MNIRHQKFSLKQILLIAAILIGAILRFTNLGQLPLTDQEAKLALQAYQISRGNTPSLSGQPLLILFDSLLFFLFGSSNFLARFLPALCGTILIASLYLLRSRIDPKVILVLAFALAIDPGLVTQSRQLNSIIPTLTLLSLTIGFLLNKHHSIAGIWAGLSLLCGSNLLFATFTLGLAILISLGFEKQINHSHPEHSWSAIIQDLLDHKKLFLSSLVLTFFLAGTGFLYIPQGISAAVGGWVEFFQGFNQNSSLPAIWMLLTLAIYHPIAVTFTVIALLHTFLNNPDQPLANGYQRFLSLWFLIALILALVYPNRQISDLIWVLIPLWLITAQELIIIISPFEQPRFVPFSHGLIVLALFILFGLQIASYSLVFPINRFNWVRIGIIFSTLVLIGLITWLVNFGWSKRASYQGLALGTVFFLLIFTLSGTIGSAFSLPYDQTFRQELWKTYPQIGDTDLIANTIHDLSRWNRGDENNLSVFLAVDSPALQWLLRSEQSLTILPEENALAVMNAQGQPRPDLLITRNVTENPSGNIPYRGQDFNWRILPPWLPNSLPNPLDWLLYRRAAWQPETIILWARSDLFPGGDNATVLQDDLNSTIPSTDIQPSP